MSDDLFEQLAGNSVAAGAGADIPGASDSMVDTWFHGRFLANLSLHVFEPSLLDFHQGI
jgi:hypothetical protein